MVSCIELLCRFALGKGGSVHIGFPRSSLSAAETLGAWNDFTGTLCGNPGFVNAVGVTPRAFAFLGQLG